MSGSGIWVGHLRSCIVTGRARFSAGESLQLKLHKCKRIAFLVRAGSVHGVVSNDTLMWLMRQADNANSVQLPRRKELCTSHVRLG